MTFDSVLMVDWAGGNDTGPTPRADAIWACLAQDGHAGAPVYLRNRAIAESWITETIRAAGARNRRLLIGFDLCFAYPQGFARHLIGTDDPLTLWDWFAARVIDTPKRNNRFALAGEINARFPGLGPFWFNALRDDVPNLPRKGSVRAGHGLPEMRATDSGAKGAFSPWQLGGAGAVGGQVIMGLPTLSRLRARFGAALSVWPFEPPTAPVVLAETYFSLLPGPLAARRSAFACKDAAQVSLYAEAFGRLSAADWRVLFDVVAPIEGWVLGLGHEHRLADALDGARAA